MQYESCALYDLRNILITICFDGKAYHGWQVQKNALTVQEVFQNALIKLFGDEFSVKGCSRTDAGVHANMYCLSVRISRTYKNKKSFKIPCENLVFALNNILPRDIAVIKCQDVPPDFHARYSCRGKQYLYKILNTQIRNPFLESYALHYRYPMDIEKMTQAAKFYLGKHDFTSFCNINNNVRGDMVRNVKKFEILKKDSMIEMKVEADGFLYNMVRIMVGTLLKVCQGKLSPTDIPYVIDGKDRTKAGKTAPPQGLYLNKVFYDLGDEKDYI